MRSKSREFQAAIQSPAKARAFWGEMKGFIGLKVTGGWIGDRRAGWGLVFAEEFNEAYY
jgi:hypothetical protein